jgi:hypothetical protein
MPRHLRHTCTSFGQVMSQMYGSLMQATLWNWKICRRTSSGSDPIVTRCNTRPAPSKSILLAVAQDEYFYLLLVE